MKNNIEKVVNKDGLLTAQEKKQMREYIKNNPEHVKQGAIQSFEKIYNIQDLLTVSKDRLKREQVAMLQMYACLKGQTIAIDGIYWPKTTKAINAITSASVKESISESKKIVVDPALEAIVSSSPNEVDSILPQGSVGLHYPASWSNDSVFVNTVLQPERFSTVKEKAPAIKSEAKEMKKTKEKMDTPWVVNAELAEKLWYDSAFAEKVYAAAQRLHVDNPNHLMAILDFESYVPATGEHFNTGRHGKWSASGLIGWTSTGVQVLGKSLTDIRKMSRLQQVDEAERYLRAFLKWKKNVTFEDLYAAVLAPSKTHASPEAAVYRRGSKEYSKNRGLDLNKDGVITKKEAAQKVVRNGHLRNYFVSKKNKDASSDDAS